MRLIALPLLLSLVGLTSACGDDSSSGTGDGDGGSASIVGSTSGGDGGGGGGSKGAVSLVLVDRTGDETTTGENSLQLTIRIGNDGTGDSIDVGASRFTLSVNGVQKQGLATVANGCDEGTSLSDGSEIECALVFDIGMARVGTAATLLYEDPELGLEADLEVPERESSDAQLFCLAFTNTDCGICVSFESDVCSDDQEAWLDDCGQLPECPGEMSFQSSCDLTPALQACFESCVAQGECE